MAFANAGSSPRDRCHSDCSTSIRIQLPYIWLQWVFAILCQLCLIFFQAMAVSGTPPLQRWQGPAQSRPQNHRLAHLPANYPGFHRFNRLPIFPFLRPSVRCTSFATNEQEIASLLVGRMMVASLCGHCSTRTAVFKFEESFISHQGPQALRTFRPVYSPIVARRSSATARRTRGSTTWMCIVHIRGWYDCSHCSGRV